MKHSPALTAAASAYLPPPCHRSRGLGQGLSSPRKGPQTLGNLPLTIPSPFQESSLLLLAAVKVAFPVHSVLQAQRRPLPKGH